jgi:hypothetical protein
MFIFGVCLKMEDFHKTVGRPFRWEKMACFPDKATCFSWGKGHMAGWIGCHEGVAKCSNQPSPNSWGDNIQLGSDIQNPRKGHRKQPLT